MSRKEELRRRILKYILLRGKATRPELVEYTGVRAATVFDVIAELKLRGFLVEPGRRGKKTGRKAPNLALHGAAGYWLGVDFRQECSAGVIIDGCGEVICREELSCARRDLNDCRREIGELVRRLRKKAGKEWELVSGIGFADPGVVDPNNAVSRKAVNIPGWENAATGEWLKGEFHLPVGIWPETMIKTRMEYMLRMPEVPESIFLLTLDEGVGGGFISNGELFAGSSGCGMEIGHLVIDPAGPVCKCGNRGCVEALVGEAGIRSKMEQAVRSGMQSSIDMEHFTLTDFLNAVCSDKAARIVADQVCKNIGQALSAVVTLLNPAMIVFGGRLSKLDSLLLTGVRRVLELNCFAGALQDLKLELARSDEYDTARGAALRMRDKLWLEE
ncbi:MAG: ROK family protein [Lentisphaerae bacterium]|nr:ROK family protein [Lentisphaerota bacterium]